MLLEYIFKIIRVTWNNYSFLPRRIAMCYLFKNYKTISYRSSLAMQFDNNIFYYILLCSNMDDDSVLLQQ